MKESEQFVDIDDIIDFFTRNGRPLGLLNQYEEVNES